MAINSTEIKNNNFELIQTKLTREYTRDAFQRVNLNDIRHGQNHPLVRSCRGGSRLLLNTATATTVGVANRERGIDKVRIQRHIWRAHRHELDQHLVETRGAQLTVNGVD